MVEEHARRISAETALRERNPNAEDYIGHERHYELARAEAGDEFYKKGKPTQKSMDRALPGQFATVLNMLNFVYDVSELIAQELLEATFTFKELKQVRIGEALGNKKFEFLQDKYAAVVGYLKSARKFGLVDFEGQLEPMWCDDKQISCRSVGWSRQQLLDTVRQEEHLPLIAEANLEALRAVLTGIPDDSGAEPDPIALQVHGMMTGFLARDDEAVRAAMKTM